MNFLYFFAKNDKQNKKDLIEIKVLFFFSLEKMLGSNIVLPSEKVVLNVGGSKFEILRKTLLSVKYGRIWKLINTFKQHELVDLCDDFNTELNEFFFDRDPTLFNYILNYYRTGKLHVSESLCPVDLNNELIYWDLDQPLMDVCCEEKLYNKEKEVDQTLANYVSIMKEVKIQKAQEKKDKLSKLKRIKSKIWNLVDNSFDKNSSSLAKVNLFCFEA
jgi:potassium voltage-gated channel delayed-rectifier subfamily S protein 3